jgi:hypothetical protein
MITTKVFSVEDGSLKIHNRHIVLWHNPEIHIASTNNCDDTEYLIPSTLIRTPKSDEELAEEEYPFILGYYDTESYIDGFLAGRQSFGEGKKYHLSEDRLQSLVTDCLLIGTNHKSNNVYDVSRLILEQFIASLTPSMYPHTITVEHDGDNYLWETLKPSYE